MAKKAGKMVKSIDTNITKDKFQEMYQNTVKGLELCIRKKMKGRNSISNTPYAVLADKEREVELSRLTLVATNIVMFCQLHDEYYEDYKRQEQEKSKQHSDVKCTEPNSDVKCTEPMWRKPIMKSGFPRLEDGTPNVKNFEVKITNTVFTEYDLKILFLLYPQACDAAEAVKMLFTELEFIVNDSKMNAYLSSAGGKTSVQSYFNLGILSKLNTKKPLEEAVTAQDVIDLAKLQCTTLAEPFSRTAAFSLNYLNYFDRFYCADIDYGFVNYMEVIEKWCDEMIESIKEQFKELYDTFSDDTFSDKKLRTDKTNEVYKKLLKKSRNVTSKSRKETKISSAAAMYVVIQASFSGNEKNAVFKRIVGFDDNLDKRVLNLKYLSANMPKIEYVHSDFRKTIKKFSDDESVLLILDPPYLKEFGLPCKDYINAFTYKDMLDMFKLLKNAKCKVILFHSRSYWFDRTAVLYGLHKVGYYFSRNIGQEYKSYYTEVYSLNIDPSVKFFDPKDNGGLYDNDFPNTHPDSGISSEKGVL